MRQNVFLIDDDASVREGAGAQTLELRISKSVRQAGGSFVAAKGSYHRKPVFTGSCVQTWGHAPGRRRVSPAVAIDP